MYSNLDLKTQLDVRELMVLESELQARGKNVIVAYLLLGFVGWLGGHNHYLGRRDQAIGQLVLSVVSIALTFIIIGMLGLLAVGIWVLVDAFSVHRWVHEQNARLEREIAEYLLAQREQGA